MGSFLKPNIFLKQFQRSIGKRRYNWRDEGIQYPGFKYYPRRSDFKDPPYEPSKLFRVERIKPLKGCPSWEKEMMKQLKLNGQKSNEYVIVKNIPEINALLWRVKHLVKIVPITFPNGFPEDSNGTYLKDNGELVVAKRLQPVESRVEALEQFQKDPKKLDGDTLRRESRKKWDTGWQPT